MSSPLKISVFNFTHGLVSDRELQSVIRAVNRQVAEDFAPYWKIRGELRLEGFSGDHPEQGNNTADMRGDAVIYLWDESDVPDALGYHDRNHRGIPFGIVFIDIATEMGENWTVTFSHEVLELLGDCQANLLVQGPHPDDAEQTVYHWREMCDAVQAESYDIDGVAVSNFVLPLYFTADGEPGSRNDFLGRRPDGATLQSFGINPGGYVGFYNPATGEHETRFGEELPQPLVDPTSGETVTPRHRQRRKNKARMARRGNRYQARAPASKPQAVVVERNQAYRRRREDRRLAVACATGDIVINRNPAPLASPELRAGSFAHNIYASGATLRRQLAEGDLLELPELAFEVERIEVPDGGTGLLDVELQHRRNEAVYAVTEVDGILLWHLCTDRERRNGSHFRIPVVAASATDARRAGVAAQFRKTVVRFFSHPMKRKAAKDIKKWLDQELVDGIERGVFGKPKSLAMVEFLPVTNPGNGVIAQLAPMAEPLAAGGNYLLFVHGIFSSIAGAFGDLLKSRYDDNFFHRLDYDRVIGADHWTVARDTLHNATEILGRLPDDCRLDIVCHSRGAGVVRCLLEHDKLLPQLQARNIRVGKVIYVAGACQGSPLASADRIAALVNVFSILTSLSGAYFPIQLVSFLLKAVQYGVNNFPGITAMAPESAIWGQLNQPQHLPGAHYIYLRSDYEPTSLVQRLLDAAMVDAFIFRGEKNDLVVPYGGAGTFDSGVDHDLQVTAAGNFGVDPGLPGDIPHTRFFRERVVREQLLQHLATR